MIKIEYSDQEIRLIHDAFGKVCIMLCDLSMHMRHIVRTQAAELLGGMSSLSKEFLHQTLDNKLMSNMRLHERSLEDSTSGEKFFWI